MLRVASCMAPNADAMCRELVRYLARALGMSVQLIETVSWSERERLLDAGEIDLCWVCGLPYVEKADRGDGLQLAVAPVMSAARYANRPVYFSDVLVRSDSPYARFADLKGETIAYNEPRSHSGYNVLCYHLARHGHTLEYFGGIVESGMHQTSLQLIVSGKVAAAAIDTTVFDAEVRGKGRIAHEVRSVATLGPSPAPPWVLSRLVTEELRLEITRCLEEMHEDAAGAEILAGWGIAELRRVTDADYDAIRVMARVATKAKTLPRARTD